MPYLVRLGPRAVRDPESIYEFIEAESSHRARGWFNTLVANIYSLEEFPERGSITSENKKAHQLLFGSKPNIYRIIYSVDKRKGAVNVLHIRHSARRRFSTE